MTSKEALNRLMILARPCAYEVREHKNSYCDMLENVIEQDLDRLEELENENFELRQKLNTEEECSVFYEKVISKYRNFIYLLKDFFFVDLIERENDYKLGFAPRFPLENNSRFMKLNKKLGDFFKEVLER